MRLKQFWEMFPLPAKAKLFWDRVTFSRITKFYFIFSVLHCFIQLIFQIQAFTINAQAADFLWRLVLQGNATDPGFAVMSGNDLHFCESVPADLSPASCQVIWSALSSENGTAPKSIASSSSTLSSAATSSSTEVGVITVTESAIPSVVSSAGTSSGSSTPLQSSAASTPGIVNGNTKEIKFGNDKIDVDGLEDLDKRDDMDVLVTTVDTNGTTVVQIDGFGFNHQSVMLSQACLYTLNWPVEKLENTKREDITFIAFQIWVLGMSTVAILNESMPHIIASLLTHILATAWGGFQIIQTNDFRVSFNKLTTDGACGINLLSSYWKDRAVAEIPSLALNAVALILSVFLSWRLVKLFGWQTFKRVGASRTVNRVYKLVLTLSIAIQLSLFFIVASIGLWIDILYNGAVGHLSTQSSLFKGVMITVLLLLVPWLAMGWISVRRELKVPMLLFLVMSFGYLGGWGAMFVSSTFRWTFVLWRFFSLVTSASVFLTLVTAVLGLLCRMNFGKGLPRYLNAEEPLSDSFVPAVSDKGDYDDEEKVEFPSGRAALPTFSAAFERDVPPGQIKFGPPRLGPRFTNPSFEPFESQSQPHNKVSQALDMSSHQTTYSRDTYPTEMMSTISVSRTVAIYNDGATLYGSAQTSRSASIGSQESYDSYMSDSSTGRTHSSGQGLSTYENPPDRRHDVFSKRWMIE